MFESLDQAIALTRDVVGGLDGALMFGADAAAGLRKFAELERLAAAGRTLLAARVDETKAWDGGAHSTMAEWMADVAGTTVGHAIATLEASRDLTAQPVVAEAVREGKLSTAQAVLVTGAVKAAPDAAEALVASATNSPVRHLANECRAVRTRADDPAERTKRHRLNRRVWFSEDPDGMIELRALLTVPDGAAVRTVLEKRTDQIFRERNRSGAVPEPRDRYMADALVELLRGGTVVEGGKKSRAVRAQVQIRVDLNALRRGHVEDGEICDAPGVGELTVQEVEALIAEDDVVMNALLTRGRDVLKEVRLDRYVTAAMRRAIAFRDPTCVVPGCDRKWGTERDHFAEGGYAGTRRTQIDELGPLCHPHHIKKTRQGWVLSYDNDVGWTFDPPEPKARSA